MSFAGSDEIMKCGHKEFYMDDCYLCTECLKKQEQQLLAASLENKRLRDAYSKYAEHFPICKIFDDMTDGGDTTNQCDCGFEKVNPFHDHSALAGLYLELMERTEKAVESYDREWAASVGIVDSLRDILKRIKEAK